MIHVAGFDTFLEDPRTSQIREQVTDTARALGRELITVDTNLKAFVDQFAPWLSYYGSAMAGVGLLLAPTVAKVRIASSMPYSALWPSGSHPMLDPRWSTGAVEIVHARASHSRLQKLIALTDDPVARRSLRVCWQGRGPELNCGRCEKCLRTMLMLEGCGVRKSFTTFPSQLKPDDVAAVRIPSRPVRDEWRETLDFVRSRRIDPTLVAAVERCLERSDPASVEPAPNGERDWPASDSGLRRELAAHHGDAHELRSELGRSRSRVAELSEIVTSQDAALRKLNAALAMVLGSRSWRATWPLRRARTVLGRRPWRSTPRVKPRG